MRLDFNVLWVEDQQQAVEAQKERLERLIRAHGFRLQVRFASSVEEAVAFLKDDVYTDNIDLILMDYDLGSGARGDQGLIEVRGFLPHREIVFYSAAGNDLWAKVAVAKVEGVYCSTRAELPDKAEGVFETLVKKVVDIDHSRGIVMGATSDIDHFVSDCLMATFNSGDANAKAKVLGFVKTRMTAIRKRFETDAAAIEAAADVSELMEKHAVYTSVDRLNLLRKILDDVGLHPDKAEGLKKYVVETIPKRNLLAHVRVQAEGFQRRLVHKDGTELTSQEMKQLRLELLASQELFEDLHAQLMPKSGPA